jgi:hypothetical protein
LPDQKSTVQKFISFHAFDFEAKYKGLKGKMIPEKLCWWDEKLNIYIFKLISVYINIAISFGIWKKPMHSVKKKQFNCEHHEDEKHELNASTHLLHLGWKKGAL